MVLLYRGYAIVGLAPQDLVRPLITELPRRGLLENRKYAHYFSTGAVPIVCCDAAQGVFFHLEKIVFCRKNADTHRRSDMNSGSL